MSTNSTFKKISHAIIGGILILALLLGGAYVYVIHFNDELKFKVASEIAVYRGGLFVDEMQKVNPDFVLNSSMNGYIFRNFCRSESIWPSLDEMRLDGFEERLVNIVPLKEYNFTLLDLSNNTISDLSPISGMRSLRSLYIGFTEVRDLSPLVGMQLDVLDVTYTPASKQALPKGLLIDTLMGYEGPSRPYTGIREIK